MVDSLTQLRAYYFWPKMQDEARDEYSKCQPCQIWHHSLPGQRPIEPELPTDQIKARQIVSINFLQTEGGNYLIVVDRHSGYITVFPMNSTKSEVSIDVLTDHFLQGGYPRQMRADGAPNLN